MPETEWTVEQSLLGGFAATRQDIDSANGNKFANDGRVRLHFYGNTGATGQVVINSLLVCNYGYDHNPTTDANDLDATTKEQELGPFPTTRFNDAAGYCTVSYTGTVTGIQVAVTRDAT